ncbi:MAG: HigA family addiction module antidote protein [Treponema sp.]|jgi:addiction module HigA family antidote|nr:HigA family addiction module antidote protein [Treponema sp.]
MAKAAKTPGEAVQAQAAAYNLSITQLAEGIKISPSAARLLINNKLRISVSFAQRLSKFFGKTPKYWIDLQTAYELAAITGDKKEAAVLKTISKAEKAPATKRTVKKAAAGKAGAKKTPGRKPAAKAGAKPAASRKAAVAKKTPGRKPAAKSAAAAKTSAPRAKRTVKKAAPATDSRSGGFDSDSMSPWTPGSDN